MRGKIALIVGVFVAVLAVALFFLMQEEPIVSPPISTLQPVSVEPFNYTPFIRELSKRTLLVAESSQVKLLPVDDVTLDRVFSLSLVRRLFGENPREALWQKFVTFLSASSLPPDFQNEILEVLPRLMRAPVKLVSVVSEKESALEAAGEAVQWPAIFAQLEVGDEKLAQQIFSLSRRAVDQAPQEELALFKPERTTNSIGIRIPLPITAGGAFEVPLLLVQQGAALRLFLNATSEREFKSSKASDGLVLSPSFKDAVDGQLPGGQGLLFADVGGLATNIERMVAALTPPTSAGALEPLKSQVSRYKKIAALSVSGRSQVQNGDRYSIVQRVCTVPQGGARSNSPALPGSPEGNGEGARGGSRTAIPGGRIPSSAAIVTTHTSFFFGFSRSFIDGIVREYRDQVLDVIKQMPVGGGATAGTSALDRAEEGIAHVEKQLQSFLESVDLEFIALSFEGINMGFLPDIRVVLTTGIESPQAVERLYQWIKESSLLAPTPLGVLANQGLGDAHFEIPATEGIALRIGAAGPHTVALTSSAPLRDLIRDAVVSANGFLFSAENRQRSARILSGAEFVGYVNSGALADLARNYLPLLLQLPEVKAQKITAAELDEVLQFLSVHLLNGTRTASSTPKAVCTDDEWSVWE